MHIFYENEYEYQHQILERLKQLSLLRFPPSLHAGGVDKFVPPVGGSLPFNIPVIVDEQATDDVATYTKNVESACKIIKDGAQKDTNNLLESMNKSV